MSTRLRGTSRVKFTGSRPWYTGKPSSFSTKRTDEPGFTWLRYHGICTVTCNRRAMVELTLSSFEYTVYLNPSANPPRHNHRW